MTKSFRISSTPLAMLMAMLIVACNGGGDSDSTVTDLPDQGAVEVDRLERKALFLSTLDVEGKTYQGDFAPFDIAAIAEAHNLALTEVTSIPRNETWNEFWPPAGHRLYFSDGSMIDLGCNYSSVTFAEGGKLLGSFVLEKNTLFPGRATETSTTTSLKFLPRYRAQISLGEYGGIDKGSIASPQFSPYGLKNLIFISSGIKPPYFHVGQNVYLNGNLKIERIVKFAPYGTPPIDKKESEVDCRLTMPHRWHDELILPLPAFDQSGPSWAVYTPYQCWRSLEARAGRLQDNDNVVGFSSFRPRGVCEIWAAEKGW